MIQQGAHASTKNRIFTSYLRPACRILKYLQRRIRRNFGATALLLVVFFCLLYYKFTYIATLGHLEPSSVPTAIVSSNTWPLPKTYADVGNASTVKEMTQFAWRGYMEFCILKQRGNELAPVSNSCSSASDGLVGVNNLLTVVESMDTLSLMNLQEEFNQGRSLIERLFHPLQTPNDVMVFEVTIRLLGGLLGAFSVTRESLFAQKAAQVAEGLTSALQGGYFPRRVKMISNQLRQYDNQSTSVPELSKTNPAEIGSLYLEFAYHSELAGDKKFLDYVNRYQEALMYIRNMNGLLPVELEVKSPWKLQANDGTYSIGAFGDSYYEYLVKRCLFDISEDSDCIRAFSLALDGIMKHLTVKTQSNNTCIVTMVIGNPMSCRMEHLACFAGGMFALGYLQNASRTDWLEYAERVTETCYLSYLHSPTGLGPEIFGFDESSNRLVAIDDMYILRPETVESIFYLYRVTGNQMYRDWGWNIMKALNSSARTASGFSGLYNMNSKPTFDNIQWSFFLAETLKYLYLLFESSDTLPIDQWVFNTEAHVIPSNRNPLRNRLRHAHIKTSKAV